MTIGWYAIPPSRSSRRKSEPWPYCRSCADQPGMTKVMGIDEDASPSIVCRGCRLKLRAWR